MPLGAASDPASGGMTTYAHTCAIQPASLSHGTAQSASVEHLSSFVWHANTLLHASSLVPRHKRPGPQSESTVQFAAATHCPTGFAQVQMFPVGQSESFRHPKLQKQPWMPTPLA